MASAMGERVSGGGGYLCQHILFVAIVTSPRSVVHDARYQACRQVDDSQTDDNHNPSPDRGTHVYRGQ